MTKRAMSSCTAPRRNGHGRRAGHLRPPAARGPRAAELADLLRLVQRPAPQPAHADHAGQRQEPGAAVGVPGAVARALPGDAARRRRRHVHGAGARTTSWRSTPPPDGCSGRYSYRPSPEARPCCGRVNRGVAILGDTLFMGTIDAHLIAVDAKSGKPIWDVAVGASPKPATRSRTRRSSSRTRCSSASAGGEFGIRGFLAAYDVKTGKEVWRFYTIPGPGEPGNETWGGDSWKRGGGPIWMTGSYDPDLNLTYWGTGNPGPDCNGDLRAGRQPLHVVGDRARRRHGQAEVALPVHAARRVRLRLDADSRARRHARGRTAHAQGDVLGEPQRRSSTCSTAPPASSCRASRS